MDPSKGTKKSPSGGSSSKSDKKPKSSPEHHHHDSKLWQAKEQVLGMPSPRREYRECVVDTSSRSQHSSEDALCCGHGGKKKGEGFSRMAVLYFLFFSCVFVVAIIGLRMFTIEDRMLRLDTDYQQQQMRIEALEEMVHQLRKVSDVHVTYKER